MTPKPQHWFRSVHGSDELKREPRAIEFLRVWSGETIIHQGGTAFWDSQNNCLDQHALAISGFTHWRLLVTPTDTK